MRTTEYTEDTELHAPSVSSVSSVVKPTADNLLRADVFAKLWINGLG